jgi:hypothetical protein
LSCFVDTVTELARILRVVRLIEEVLKEPSGVQRQGERWRRLLSVFGVNMRIASRLEKYTDG